MGKHLDALKRKRMEDRMNDPHAWAYEIEKRADQRSMTGAIAFVLCLALGWFVYTIRQEQKLMQAQILSLQANTMPVGYATPAYYAAPTDPNAEVPPPPPGFEIVP